MTGRRWIVATWIVAAIVAGAIAYGVVRIPLQVTDALIPILKAQATPSVAAATIGSFGNVGYLRPFRIGQIQVLFELARGRHYAAVFKGFHVLLVFVAVALFVAILRVRTRTDFLVAAFALTVLTGLHTFLGTVWEAYPINHFLEIGVFCLATVALAQSRGGWWSDLLACAIFVVGALTLESGLLVWVIAVAAYATGLRGISRRGVTAMTALIGAYLVLRFGVLATGAPSLAERSSGFGAERLDPAELIERFGRHPYLFYAYNIASSMLSVLASQPRAGQWTVVRELHERQAVLEGTALNVVSSLLTTAVIVLFVGRRLRDWRRWQFAWPDHLVVIALAVLAANAVISFGYTKDEIMSPAGMLYAVAAYVAVRDLALRMAFTPRAIGAAASVVLCVVALAWDVRAVGLHYQMRRMAFTVRNDWVVVDRWLVAQHASPATPQAQRLVRTLRDDALRQRVINPYFFPRQARRWLQ